jgi:hypothetical protein
MISNRFPGFRTVDLEHLKYVSSQKKMPESPFIHSKKSIQRPKMGPIQIHHSTAHENTIHSKRSIQAGHKIRVIHIHHSWHLAK